MDKVGNLFSAILNAQARKKPLVKLHFSKMNQNILNTLIYEGYIQDFKVQENNIIVSLYPEKTLKIQRISTPGKRVYFGVHEMNKTSRGFGTLLLSTSKGIMSSQKAEFLHLGGEALCYIF